MTDVKSPLLPALTVRLAALWILVGALFKLLYGTPLDLPPMVRAVPLEIGLVYKLAIGIELAITAVAFFRPRLGWWLVALQYVAFGVVLAPLVWEGAESCGCFGSSGPKPSTMAIIDGALLALMLASRPWRLRSRGLPTAALAPLCAVLLAVPWPFDRSVTAPPPDDGKSPMAKGWASLPIEDWVGKTIYDTPLADLLVEDVGTLPTDGVWVLWRWQCSHCADHLEQMVREPPDALFITLVRVPEKLDSDENGVVYFMPEGPHVVHASLTDKVEYVLETPGELWLEGGVIVSAREGADAADDTEGG